jgi:RHS repeat-associated protein
MIKPTSGTSKAANADGTLHSELRYKPWGELRYAWNATPSPLRYTAQRGEGMGLYDYRARFYDPSLGRFTQADTIIPSAAPLAWDRYAGMMNNPVRYTDPSGHWVCEDEDCNKGQKEYRHNPRSNGFHAPNNNLWISGNTFLNPEGHKGVDYGPPPYELFASGYGTVVVADACSLSDCEGDVYGDELKRKVNLGYGNVSIIEYPYASMPFEFARDLGILNGQSLYLLYAHLQDAPEFEVGDMVVPGQPIGMIGNTGYSTGPHLHFEARIGPRDTLGRGGPLCTDVTCGATTDSTTRYVLYRDYLTAIDPGTIPWMYTTTTVPGRWNDGWR